LNWLSLLKSLHLRHFSKPKSHRRLYRLVHRCRCRRIVELGITDLNRTLRMLSVAGCLEADEPVRYTGVDCFEARDEHAPRLQLKETHRSLAATGSRFRLAPGTAASVLRRLANELADTDLLLVSAFSQLEPDSDAWYYVPRMLHQRSLVLVESLSQEGTPEFAMLPISEIESRAEAASRRRRRAA